MIILISVVAFILAILIEMTWCCFRLSSLLSEMEEQYKDKEKLKK